MASKVIPQLKAIRGLKVECPNCQTEVSAKRLNLFNMYEPYPPLAQKIVRRRHEEAEVEIEQLKLRKGDLDLAMTARPLQIATGAHASNFGKIGEQILPAFTTFPYERDECRILFNPIDYIVFSGLCNDGKIEAIKFVDAKTSGGRLTPEQRRIGNIITSGNVKHKVIPR